MGRKIVRRREMQVRHSQTESSRLFRAILRAPWWGTEQQYRAALRVHLVGLGITL